MFDLMPYIPELLSVGIIAIFMAISPGADFVLITRNSLLYQRSAGLYSALGIALAIWVHVAYSIAGVAVIISKSIVLFSVVKYLGAAYLMYIGWKTLSAAKQRKAYNVEASDRQSELSTLSHFQAFKLGFVTNALNPKTTLFFLSLFTQVIDSHTPLWIQLIYGAMISLAHLVWFSLVACFLSQPRLLRVFNDYKHLVEKCVGGLLIMIGIKVAVSSNNS